MRYLRLKFKKFGDWPICYETTFYNKYCDLTSFYGQYIIYLVRRFSSDAHPSFQSACCADSKSVSQLLIQKAVWSFL